MDQLEPEIMAYYSQEWDEDARLRTGLNELELVRTQELVRRHLPDGPQRVVDIGGGSGIHAEWLIADGHTVDLIDPVPLHLQQAEERLGDHERFTARLGDGRAIPLDDHAADVALLFGPLYHLTERSDRLLAIREGIRVVRPGGMVLAAAITRFASLFSGLAEGEIFVDAFADVVRADLAAGQHRNPLGADYFTTAFFHHPTELVSELTDAGVVDPVVFAVEGPVGASPLLEDAWGDGDRRAVILEFVRRVEREPSLLGIGPHLLGIGTAPA